MYIGDLYRCLMLNKIVDLQHKFRRRGYPRILSEAVDLYDNIGKFLIGQCMAAHITYVHNNLL
ncbi:hypothetical protein D3C74_389070 [compost metagenome]